MTENGPKRWRQITVKNPSDRERIEWHFEHEVSQPGVGCFKSTAAAGGGDYYFPPSAATYVDQQAWLKELGMLTVVAAPLAGSVELVCGDETTAEQLG